LKILTDQIGTIHTIQSVPQRIVSLVPSQTELLVDLGLEEKIVGITKFCVHPYYLKNVTTIIGGTKNVHFEKIKSLNPDIIIGNKEENTLEIITELQKICPVWVTNVETIEDNFTMINDFGSLLSCKVSSQKITDKLHFALTDFKSFIQEKAFKKVAYFIWKNPYMVVGNNTFINSLLELNHLENIYATKSRYPEIEIKRIRIEGDPDLIFLSSEPYPFKEEDAFEIGRYTHHATTFFVDGEMFSWHGSRLIKALNYFKKIHERI